MNCRFRNFFCHALGCFAAFLTTTSGSAATLWTGPAVSWTKSSATPADTILPGKVVLRRDSRLPLYNTALNETSARPGSPKGIVFAFGDISNYQNLTYRSLDDWRNGNLAALILNKPMVAHILDGDIYFSITFTSWGTHGAGTVAYRRSTPAAVVLPSVTLTSPADNASFTAPATVNLSANATGGTISDVSFYNGAALLGTVASAPYGFTINNLAAGSYSLTAVARNADGSATSGVVHITVTAPVTPPAVTLTSPVEGAAFTAPATIDFSADATGTDITGVSFFNGLTLLGAASSAPYNFTANGLAAGSYSLTAVVTAAGGTATSGVVHVTISAPASDIRLSSPAISNGQFSFTYSADAGSTYVVQSASAIDSAGKFDWAPVSTNVATGSTGIFSESQSSGRLRLFRVGRVQ